MRAAGAKQTLLPSGRESSAGGNAAELCSNGLKPISPREAAAVPRRAGRALHVPPHPGSLQHRPFPQAPGGLRCCGVGTQHLLRPRGRFGCTALPAQSISSALQSPQRAVSMGKMGKGLWRGLQKSHLLRGTAAGQKEEMDAAARTCSKSSSVLVQVFSGRAGSVFKAEGPGLWLPAAFCLSSGSTWVQGMA